MWYYDDIDALRECRAAFREELEEAIQAGDDTEAAELRRRIAKLDEWIRQAPPSIDRWVRFEGLEVPEELQDRFWELRTKLPLN